MRYIMENLAAAVIDGVIGIAFIIFFGIFLEVVSLL